jgi:Type VI secretion, TssG
MEKDSVIELILEEIRNLNCDVKAEAQLTLALENGLQPEDFMVSSDKLFTREYSKDLVGGEIVEDPRKKQLLQLHLSRGGIFDQLPEGLFFAIPKKKASNYSAVDMAADYNLNKKKEEEIRRFFLPFENDFFWQRIQLEQEETRLLEGLQSGILNDYFIKFWNIPRSIPKSFIAPLILLLPYAHQITGNLPLTAECLEQLLLEPVLVRKKRSVITNTPTLLSAGLGDAQLGTNMLCGEEFWEDVPVIEFVVGPLQRSRVSEYLEGGKLFDLLSTFSRFFVPAGLDVEFSIRLPEEKLNMVMERDEGPVLGYSSVL